jgi:ankyrin repeat protein
MSSKIGFTKSLLILMVLIVWLGTLVQASELTDACVDGNVDKVKSLISSGADLNSKDKNGIPALVIATYVGQTEIVKLLLEGGANVNDRISGGWDGFMKYVDRVKAGKEEPQFTLDKFIPDMTINPKDLPKLIGDQEQELNALMVASYLGREEIVDLLIEKKADVIASTKLGWSPLIFAASRNHYRIVQKLINAGAGIDHRDRRNNTALIYAVYAGNNTSIKLLLINGASTDDKLFSAVKFSPLQLAAALKNFEAVKALVEAGADVNYAGLSMKNAIVFAVESGDYPITKYLLEKGSEHNTNGLVGPSPLKIAKMKGYKDIEELLIQYNATE